MEEIEMTDKEMRDKAYDTVVALRGSWDVPGFDACVVAEYLRLKAL
jgi:hypothetical protein